jgi:hypothetical protein
MRTDIALKSILLLSSLFLASWSNAVLAQASQGPTTRIQGNTEINVTSSDVTAIATGQNNVARNRIGVIKGDKKGNTKITVNAAKVTTVVGGRNKKACTNIGGIVSDECN